MLLFIIFDGKLEKLIEPAADADISAVLLEEDAAASPIQRPAGQSAQHP
jgi:hypothetical protein